MVADYTCSREAALLGVGGPSADALAVLSGRAGLFQEGKSPTPEQVGRQALAGRPMSSRVEVLQSQPLPPGLPGFGQGPWEYRWPSLPSDPGSFPELSLCLPSQAAGKALLPTS